MAWSKDWSSNKKGPSEEETKLLEQCKKNYRSAFDWEANARIWYDYDTKFANGDAHNNYQWPDDILQSRTGGAVTRPCLTINKTQQHNLAIINDSKQNKPGIRIRPVGAEASFDAAQIYQQIIYHIEYISSAENIYDKATTTQVQGGIGYWRVNTDYINNESFDQEIYIKGVKDPMSVYLDPDINEIDGSDARFGLIFEDIPKDKFNVQYPKFADIATSSVLGNSSNDGWMTQNNIRVAEYYYRTEKEDKLIAFIDPATNEQVIAKRSALNEEGIATAKSLKQAKDPNYRERPLVTNDVKWCKIAGDRIIDDGIWLGDTIPIVRVVGTETIIDGVLDRKGHTRALINAQQIYNYATSANVEYGALQTKSPYIAAQAAIEGYEEYYKTANTTNSSYLPYNHIDDDGNPIPPPKREPPPQPGLAYVQQMQIAQNEMMMSSGQYQSQMGENENAKSGVAINARQRQGDRATYHFIDNLAIAIRRTGKIILDLIPKIYDTKRIMQIQAMDGKILNVTIDPKAEQHFQKLQAEQEDRKQRVERILLNPTIGQYDVQSDTGPSFATRRMEAFNAMTQIAAQNKDFMNIGGDLYWKVADFPEADILAERWRKVIRPDLLEEGMDPEIEKTMHQASDKIEQLSALIAKQQEEISNREKELTIKAQELDLKLKNSIAEQARLDYEAETKRLIALGNSGPGISIEQIQPILKQLIQGMISNGELVYKDIPGINEGGNHIPGNEPDEDDEMTGEPQGYVPEKVQQEPIEEDSIPGVKGSRLAPDGQHYVDQGNGQFARVDTVGQ